MPSRNWQLCLQDILQSISEIQQRTTGITFEEFERNKTIVKAALYDFVVIGEATRSIPDEIQCRYPRIPWRLMVGMRNIVTHEYFQVNLSRIWQTIQNDLPSLVPQLQEVLEFEARSLFSFSFNNLVAPTWWYYWCCLCHPESFNSQGGFLKNSFSL